MSNDADLNKSRLQRLYDQKTALEGVVGEALEWDATIGRKGARIGLTSPFSDISDRQMWPAMGDWLIERQERMRGVLASVGGIPRKESRHG